MNDTNHMSLFDLAKKNWNIIWGGSRSEGRISRGEYWISVLILGILNLLGSFIVGILPFPTALGVVPTLSLSVILIAGIRIFFALFQLKLIIKRSHDINKSGWYFYIPLFALFGLIVVCIVIFTFLGLININAMSDTQLIDAIYSNIPLLISGLLSLACFLVVLYRSLMLGFQKGTVGSNTYGEDPLPLQPSSRSYWMLGIILFVANILLEMAFGASTYINTSKEDAYENAIEPAAQVNMDEGQMEGIVSGGFLTGEY